MISLLCSLSRKSRTLLAVLIVCLVPAALQAETIIITNKLPIVVKVQTTYVVQGRVAVGPTYTLKPGDATPGIVLPGVKNFAVFDPNMPPRPLGIQSNVAGNMDISLDIVPAPPTPNGPKVIFK
jgi:hypothetical protein